MPAKSKHGRGKHPHKNKLRQRPAGTGLPQQQVTQDAVKPVAAPVRTVSTAGAKAAAPAATIDTSYIVGELKRIGILTAITVVLLIVLTIIFK
ncbi:MAG: hypothetical protein WC370_01160 [Dehalococcoidales bacterium]|jgi:hypothetical protein